MKHLTKYTLCLKYFRNIVIVMTKGKNKKMKITKIYLFFLPPLSLSGRGHCWLLQPTLPPTFVTAKKFEIFFIDTWVFGQREGKLNEWQYWQNQWRSQKSLTTFSFLYTTCTTFICDITLVLLKSIYISIFEPAVQILHCDHSF